ncbi:MAG: DUF2442 domain-containing protein [Spirochaetaceae bacterium]|nr:DUF2442 domain-containing protein [Spirochaetaceae bacterium]
MVVYVSSVEPKENYNLLITFENGEKRLFNCASLLDKTVYKPLKNKAFFNTVKTEYGTVVWNNQIDIAPEYLYQNGMSV